MHSWSNVCSGNLWRLGQMHQRTKDGQLDCPQQYFADVVTHRLLSIGVRIYVLGPLILHTAWYYIHHLMFVFILEWVIWKILGMVVILPLTWIGYMNHWTPFFQHNIDGTIAGSHQHKTTLSFQLYITHLPRLQFTSLCQLLLTLWAVLSGLILQVDLYSPP